VRDLDTKGRKRSKILFLTNSINFKQKYIHTSEGQQPFNCFPPSLSLPSSPISSFLFKNSFSFLCCCSSSPILPPVEDPPSSKLIKTSLSSPPSFQLFSIFTGWKSKDSILVNGSRDWEDGGFVGEVIKFIGEDISLLLVSFLLKIKLENFKINFPLK